MVILLFSATFDPGGQLGPLLTHFLVASWLHTSYLCSSLSRSYSDPARCTCRPQVTDSCPFHYNQSRPPLPES
jgi:hypothetical protein